MKTKHKKLSVDAVFRQVYVVVLCAGLGLVVGLVWGIAMERDSWEKTLVQTGYAHYAVSADRKVKFTWGSPKHLWLGRDNESEGRSDEDESDTRVYRNTF